MKKCRLDSLPVVRLHYVRKRGWAEDVITLAIAVNVAVCIKRLIDMCVQDHVYKLSAQECQHKVNYK